MTAARDSLGEVTKLPAAQQLSGELRTQLTQLIANFNELITTNTEWKASYAKVDANLTALIGAQTADESTTAAGGDCTRGGDRRSDGRRWSDDERRRSGGDLGHHDRHARSRGQSEAGGVPRAPEGVREGRERLGSEVSVDQSHR